MRGASYVRVRSPESSLVPERLVGGRLPTAPGDTRTWTAHAASGSVRTVTLPYSVVTATGASGVGLGEGVAEVSASAGPAGATRGPGAHAIASTRATTTAAACRAVRLFEPDQVTEEEVLALRERLDALAREVEDK